MGKVYALETEKGVYALLSNIHYVRALRFARSDYDACNILIDFLLAYESADLTPRQKDALALVYERDITQKEAAEYMGASQQAVQQHIKAAVRKIAETYSKGGVNNVRKK